MCLFYTQEKGVQSSHRLPTFERETMMHVVEREREINVPSLALRVAI